MYESRSVPSKVEGRVLRFGVGRDAEMRRRCVEDLAWGVNLPVDDGSDFVLFAPVFMSYL